MKYKETLETCEKCGISIYDASIADQVDFFFNGGKGRELPTFEQLCDLAAETYRKVDCTTSTSQVVESLRSLIEVGLGINKISRQDIIDHITY